MTLQPGQRRNSNRNSNPDSRNIDRKADICYTESEKISHGKAAEILGIHKLELIEMYGKIGLPYFDVTIQVLNSYILTRLWMIWIRIWKRFSS